MRVLPFGDTAALVEVADLDAVLDLYAELAQRDLEGIEDLVPAARTLLVRIDPGVTSVTAMARLLEDLEPAPRDRHAGAEVEIPVVYDGADLDEVGELTGLGPRGVVAAHTGQPWTVGFVGFAPGFAYLVGDGRLQVPRRADPRAKVPAGAVGLADAFSGIYPRSSPGGWQLIGHTEVATWDVERDPPALLRPGGTVRFVESG